MKKLNLGNINAGLNSLKAATDNAAQNGRFELIDTALIDFAAKNSYAADDNEESYKELAANIDEVGLLTPLGVIVNGNRYTLFSGERLLGQSLRICIGRKCRAMCLRQNLYERRN